MCRHGVRQRFRKNQAGNTSQPDSVPQVDFAARGQLAVHVDAVAASQVFYLGAAFRVNRELRVGLANRGVPDRYGILQSSPDGELARLELERQIAPHWPDAD